MAYKYCSILAFIVILNTLLSGFALAGREIPEKSKPVDMKQPESFTDHEGTVLIPGLGRYYVFPKPGSHFNPYTYNPVTGTSGGGNGLVTPGIGSNGGTSGSYIPGGDDTFIPNPGYEVPTPRGGSVPATSTP